MPVFTVYKQLTPISIPGREYFKSNLEKVGTVVAKSGEQAIDIAKVVHKVLHPLVQECLQ